VSLPLAAPSAWWRLAAAQFGASNPMAKALPGGMGPVTLAGWLYASEALATALFAVRTR
jgi:hypothetical protein